MLREFSFVKKICKNNLKLPKKKEIKQQRPKTKNKKQEEQKKLNQSLYQNLNLEI